MRWRTGIGTRPSTVAAWSASRRREIQANDADEQRPETASDRYGRCPRSRPARTASDALAVTGRMENGIGAGDGNLLLAQGEPANLVIFVQVCRGKREVPLILRGRDRVGRDRQSLRQVVAGARRAAAGSVQRARWALTAGEWMPGLVRGCPNLQLTGAWSVRHGFLGENGKRKSRVVRARRSGPRFGEEESAADGQGNLGPTSQRWHEVPHHERP